ncbi:hypothetical protein F8M41_017072 [Gigaspora margarita]|uniref:Uncharacterized protein n=1 Tax=Gigaspora margarita TaxID=4874 RepID=A0A8H4ANI2_GIGMA|nr:hypothetical protein F8M41_017072 [Gigaspora margarita]
MTSQTTGIQLLRQQNNGGQSQNNNNWPQRPQITSNTINISIDTQLRIDFLEGASFNTMQNEIPSKRIKFSSALFSGFSFT